MDDKIIQNDAKQIVDMLFETKTFKDSITRDDMTAVENLLSFCMKSRFDSYVKVLKFTKQLNEK